MNIIQLTALELRRYWTRSKNYLSIVLIVALSIGSALFINGVLALLISGVTETKINQLSFNQLISSFSIAWLVILLNYCVSETSDIITLDYRTNIDQVVFSKPITPAQYAWSKTFFALFQNILFGLVAAAAIIGASIYYNDLSYELKDQIPSIINFVIYYVLPLQIILALFISWLSLTLKNKSVLYYTYGFFLLVPITISALFNSFDNIYPSLTWLDPTAGLLISEITKFYTASEVNNFSVNSQFIINRLVWVLVLIVICFFAFKRFNFEPQTNKDKKIDITPLLFDRALPSQHFPTQFGQLLTLTKFNVVNAFKKLPIYILTSVMVGYFSFYSFTNFSIDKSELYPTTSSVILWILSASLFYIIIYIGYRLTIIYDIDRAASTTNVIMSKPVSHVNMYFSKILSIWIEIGIVTSLLTFVAIISQFYFQSPVKNPLILIGYWLVMWFMYLFVISFGFLIIAIFNQSKIAFVAVLFVFATPFVVSGVFRKYPILNSDLFNSTSGSIFRTNDFAGFGYGIDKILTLRFYWLAVTASVLSLIFYIALRRDNVNKVISRFLPKTKILKYFIPLSVIAMLGSGYYVKSKEDWSDVGWATTDLEYEYYSMFKNDIPKPVPTVTDVSVDYDLYPQQAKYTIKGKYKMVNNNNVAINDILVDFDNNKNVKNIQFDKPIDKNFKGENLEFAFTTNPNLGVNKFKFLKPVEPNEEIIMEFEKSYKRNGYSDQDSLDLRTIQNNGTFFENSSLPTVGFNFQKILGSKKLINTPEVSDYINKTDLNKNLFSNSTNYINLTSTIITDGTQKAIAPGTKISEETQNDGRRKYVYNNPKTLFFTNVLSARLDVKQETFQGINIEIYHHPQHTVNLDKILEGAKETLAYMQTNIGPYPYDYLRIVEFGGGSYAQSFAGTVALGENLFITKADSNNPKKLNYPFYITAHEVAHQWWGHQVTASQGKGSSFLTESLAEYSSNRVIANKYGEDALYTYKRTNLEDYLTGRKSFVQESDEKSVSEVGYFDNQLFVHYQKGSIVLDNISKILSEGGLNGLLKKYVADNKQAPPFANYQVLVNRILESTPDVSKPYIKEVLKDVVVYDNSITKFNTLEKDGQFITTIDLNLTKKKIQNDKLESVQFPTQDYTIDSYTNTTNTNFLDGKFISREVVNVPSGKQQVTIITKTRPDLFILDKDIKYIDNNPKNNQIGGKPQTLIDLLSDPAAIANSIAPNE
jgi:ABC-2 type transport system permease protein